MKWISVKVRKPKPGQDVLAWCGRCVTAVYRRQTQRITIGDWHTEDGTSIIFNVTHWMPLPKPPKEKQ